MRMTPLLFFMMRGMDGGKRGTIKGINGYYERLRAIKFCCVVIYVYFCIISPISSHYEASTVIYSLLLATLCMGCGGRIGMRQLGQLEAQIDKTISLDCY